MGNVVSKFAEKRVEEGLESPQVASEEAHVDETTAYAPKGDDSVETGKKNRKKSWIGHVVGGGILGDRLVTRQIPLLLMCLVYLLLIVGNRYHIEALSREKQAAEERLNYQREARIQMQKQYQQSVKISQIAEDLKETGVGITAGPPYEIEK